MKKRVELITDGACSGNPGPGGWAALLRFGASEKMISGNDSATTNNRMELQAVIEGLSALKEPCIVELRTDSKYVMHAFTQKWLQNWQRNSWKTANGDPVKNQDLWKKLIDLESQHEIKWSWVKGHSGDVDNERVDQEARRQVESIRNVAID